MYIIIKKILQSSMSSPNRVRWVFDCENWFPSKNEWSHAFRSIQSEEKERIGRFVFKRDAKSSIIGQLMIMKYLSETACVPWSNIKIKRDTNNKPFIEDCNLNFNVSHDESLVVFAGEKNTSVGVDIMRNHYKGGKSLSEFFRLMHRNFSLKEWDYINNGTEKQKINTFYRFWCLKESYVKAIGTGLTINLRNVCFVPKQDLKKNDFVTDTELYVNNEVMHNWVFHEYLYHDYTITVCLNRNIHPIEFKMLSFNELIYNAEYITEDDENYCNIFMAKENQPK
ncbi:L-aminoadipate-semialdehyde dehydrogenase-phosphopantetheinyl transferase [Daktulosphaira vitifoliae]|uniref:L-aminoadipate-semialdehyde dehydrogenase-phosphopantetheinyl transferase n=1 Tax=Daktulosphaira vitifoliae TaxID=58002 RepID=UPI0021A99A42|nr:L-aminoadipate-semialdehyde dehydrogenase-phosphopantetheinyl transferase [Daktulosphaira vitifoliae]